MFDEVVDKMEEFNSARKHLEEALEGVETNLEELNKLREKILKMLGDTSEATVEEPEKSPAPAKKTPAKKAAAKKQAPKAVVAPAEDAVPTEEDAPVEEATPVEEPTPAETVEDDSDSSDEMEDLFLDDSKDSSEKKSTSTVDVSDEVEDDFDNIQF